MGAGAMMLRRFAVFAAILLGGVLLPTAPAFATCGDGASTCFVRGVGGNWNANTTWSTSSGGGSCTCTPAAGDSIVIDSASGSSTINASLSVANIDMSGTGGSGSPFAATLTHNGSVTVTITGTVLKFTSGMTYTPISATSSLFTFTGAGTLALTSATKVLASLTVNGTGSVVLQDNLLLNFSAANSVLTLTAGTFDANNKNVTTGNVTASGAGTRTLTMGSGTWTISGTSFTVATSGGLTLNTNTAVLTFTNATTGGTTFNMGTSNTFPTVNIGPNPASVLISATTTATIGTLTVTGAVEVRFTASFTTTISTGFTVSGAAATPVALIATAADGTATVSIPAGATINWAFIKDITFTGAGATITATNCIDGQHNAGLTCTPPATGTGGGRIIGGYLLERDLAPASNDNDPVRLDRAA